MGAGPVALGAIIYLLTPREHTSRFAD
jgi:hypothetical protein